MAQTIAPAAEPALQSRSVPAPASAASVPLPAPAVPRTSDAVAKVSVIEDDNVRIEETRLRGQPQRITVQSKIAGSRPYEILVAPGGKDLSQDRGAAGQRTWSLFGF